MQRTILLFVFLLASCASIAVEKDILFLSKPKSSWVMESKNAFVLEDKNPKAPVHLLIVPKEPIKNLLEASPALLGEMLNLAKLAAAKYGVDESGFRVVINTNEEGGQHIYHLHMHVLGGRKMKWPPG